MNDIVSDRTLWEWLDEGSDELARHLARHPEDRARVDELSRTIEACRGRAMDTAPTVGVRTRPDSVGRFNLIRPIGRGGMGIVYEAEQESPRRRVAVKLLRDVVFEDDAVRVRLAREAAALGRLSHPHIATVFEHGVTEGGEAYLAMELVEGVPLDVWARERRARTREIVEIVEKVARAVHHAHERGIVHRDLKPSNVLVDAHGAPKVLDFGLAHLAGTGASQFSALTTSGRLFGTLAYMSPEQARGVVESDPRSDVYSLGVLLFELLSGLLPYDLSARSLPEAARVIAEDAPLRLARVDRRLVGDLDVITQRALEKEPERRIASAVELADDLRRHLDGRAIHARVPSVGYHAWCFVRRHALALASLATITALLVFGAYAAAVRIDLGPLQAIGGGWYAEASPFDGLRWEGDAPVVKLDGTWYDLVEIEGLHASYVVGFCKQNAGSQWRRRFREDLLQVLNRMGKWPVGAVDLVVRDRATHAVLPRPGVELTRAKRQAIYRRQTDWYFGPWAWTESGLELEHAGKAWELVSIDGVTTAELRTAGTEPGTDPRAGRIANDIDAVFMLAAKRSPNERVEIVLRDPVTREELVLHDVERTMSGTVVPRYTGGPSSAAVRK